MANRQITQVNSSPAPMAPKVAKARFDLTALTPVAASDVVKSGVYIPEGAIITRAWYFVDVTLTGGGSDAAAPKLGITSDDDAFVATIAISAGGNVWDQGARGTLIDNPAISGDAATTLVHAALNSATMVHCAVDEEIILTNVTNTITAGKLTVFVEYVQTGLLVAIG
tara:strand:- start:8009 stop:8512 length:504 start_codon:yes stop_codon:yes gene_type:complete